MTAVTEDDLVEAYAGGRITAEGMRSLVTDGMNPSVFLAQQRQDFNRFFTIAAHFDPSGSDGWNWDDGELTPDGREEILELTKLYGIWRDQIPNFEEGIRLVDAHIKGYLVSFGMGEPADMPKIGAAVARVDARHDAKIADETITRGGTIAAVDGNQVTVIAQTRHIDAAPRERLSETSGTPGPGTTSGLARDKKEKTMSTKIPVTLEGNLTADPEYGVSKNNVKYARFQIAINDRVKDPATDAWIDGPTAFHRVSTFGKVAENVRASLQKGDTALVVGDLEQRQWIDSKTGEQRQGTEVVADTVGVSLKFRSATVNRPEPAAGVAPKVDGPDVTATGPVTTPSTGWETAQIGLG